MSLIAKFKEIKAGSDSTEFFKCLDEILLDNSNKNSFLRELWKDKISSDQFKLAECELNFDSGGKNREWVP